MGIRELSDAAGGGRRVFIVGGAGFIGSHFIDRFLGPKADNSVTVYDNFSSGFEHHFAQHTSDPRLTVVAADAKDGARLEAALTGHDLVIHLAANPDIARAVEDPDVDFREGTLLTRNVLEAMRETGCGCLLYASGSGVYGDIGETVADENQGPLLPISTYGASKLACEGLISAYCHMFGLSASIFRFGNVVGPRQTHGVGYDFVRKLRNDPTRLEILGDGSQSKSYVHVDDILDAVLLAAEKSASAVDVFNVATGDYIAVREIAELAVAAVGLDPCQVEFVFGDEARGWKGDVPIVRLDTARIRALGWRNRFSSRQAMESSLSALLTEVDAGDA